jgi:hypothetical protein
MEVRLDGWQPGEDVRRAVRHFWTTRASQAEKQSARGVTDQGLRGAATGGAQLDGFVDAIVALLLKAGVRRDCIYLKKAIELPGYYRPTKKWDLVVVRDGQLLAALEAKSHVESFGERLCRSLLGHLAAQA